MQKSIKSTYIGYLFILPDFRSWAFLMWVLVLVFLTYQLDQMTSAKMTT